VAAAPFLAVLEALPVALAPAAVAVADPVAPPGTLALETWLILSVLVTAPLSGVTLMASAVEESETVEPTLAPGAPAEIREATPGGCEGRVKSLVKLPLTTPGPHVGGVNEFAVLFADRIRLKSRLLYWPCKLA